MAKVQSFRIPTLAFLIVLMAVCNSVINAQEPRRDDKWPPPAVLKMARIFHDECLEKTGATAESIKEFSDGQIHEDEKLKCYMNCLFQDIHVVDDNGDVHLETLFETVPGTIRGKLIEMSENCIHPEGETLCDKAWWFHQCWKKADPVHYFLP